MPVFIPEVLPPEEEWATGDPNPILSSRLETLRGILDSDDRDKELDDWEVWAGRPTPRTRGEQKAKLRNLLGSITAIVGAFEAVERKKQPGQKKVSRKVAKTAKKRKVKLLKS